MIIGMQQGEGQNSLARSTVMRLSHHVSNLPLLQYPVLEGTVEADTVTNTKFLKLHAKIIATLIAVMFLLKVLPSPLLVDTTRNSLTDPVAIRTAECQGQEWCRQGETIVETITLRKLNPLQRELTYYANVNGAEVKQLNNSQVFGEISELNIKQQILWVEIFCSRNGDPYGEVLYSLSGEEAYEVVLLDEAILFLGEVHILNQASYLIRIYKKGHRTLIQPRNLQDELEDDPPLLLNETIVNDIIPKDKKDEQSDTTTDETPQPSMPQQSNSSTTEPVPDEPVVIQPQTQPSIEPEPQVQPQPEEKWLGIPLTVKTVRHSTFYTGTQLLVRYISFLYGLWVWAETASAPLGFHLILVCTANPLIFTEIAFPNYVINLISSMISSTYMAYIPLFLYYTHRTLSNPRLDLLVKTSKIIVSICLYVTSVILKLHNSDLAAVEIIQGLLIVLVLVPIVDYLWKLYFVRRDTVLHRNVIFVMLALTYFIFLFLSGYIVKQGWKKLTFYLVVQTYGVNLCYLTTRAAPGKKQKAGKNQDRQEEGASSQPQLVANPMGGPAAQKEDDEPFVRVY